MYLTPDRFKNMGLGSDLEDVSDVELTSILDRASALVDSYCAVPSRPQKHSFKGGTITGESHSWRPGQVRLFPWHSPIKTIDSFRVYATNDVYLEVQTNDIYVEPSGGFFEIVALSMTPHGFWGASQLVSLSNPVSKIDYTYGYSFEAFNERLQLTDAGEYRAQNQFWDESVDPVIYVDEVATASGFSIDPYEGVVVFDPQLSATQVVSADYTYTLPSAVAQATGIAASSVISDRDLVSKGMGNLAEISVAEIRLRRDARRTGTVVAADVLPDTAKALLAPFRFITAM